MQLFKGFVGIFLVSNVESYAFRPSFGPALKPRPMMKETSHRSLPPLLTSLILCSYLASQPVLAISGGGLDFASSDISKRDFSKGDYSKKDFSGSVANEAKFIESVLRGARFFKADLKDADFTGADCTGVSMEETDLTNTNFKNAVLEATYFTASTLDQAKSIENADFTDAVMRGTMQKQLCNRPDAKGTNPKTGVDTRDSLMCLD